MTKQSEMSLYSAYAIERHDMENRTIANPNCDILVLKMNELYIMMMNTINTENRFRIQVSFR